MGNWQGHNEAWRHIHHHHHRHICSVLHFLFSLSRLTDSHSIHPHIYLEIKPDCGSGSGLFGECSHKVRKRTCESGHSHRLASDQPGRRASCEPPPSWHEWHTRQAVLTAQDKWPINDLSVSPRILLCVRVSYHISALLGMWLNVLSSLDANMHLNSI